MSGIKWQPRAPEKIIAADDPVISVLPRTSPPLVIWIDGFACEKCGKEWTAEEFGKPGYDEWPIPCSREFVTATLSHIGPTDPRTGKACHGRLIFTQHYHDEVCEKDHLEKVILAAARIARSMVALGAGLT